MRTRKDDVEAVRPKPRPRVLLSRGASPMGREGRSSANSELLSLQRTAGNASVERGLRQGKKGGPVRLVVASVAGAEARPSAVDLVQRVTTKRPTKKRSTKKRASRSRTPRGRPIVVQVRDDTGRISSVSTRNLSRPASNARGGQGDHTTAYSSFLSMIRNQVMGKTVAEAAHALVGMVNGIKAMPGMLQNNARYLHPYLDRLNIGAISSAHGLEAAMETIVNVRNQVPLTSFIHPKSTGGHGESHNVALLDECDDAFRRDEQPRYNADQMNKAIWELLDYVPTDGTKDAQIVNVLTQHMMQLELSYPHIMANLIDLLGHRGRGQAFQYLESDRQLKVLIKISDNDRKERLLEAVEANLGIQ